MTEERVQLLTDAATAAGPEYVALLKEGKWNPLEDDGQCQRLAVRLRISVSQSVPDEEEGEAYSWARIGNQEFDEGGEDLYAATRNSVVRAAAALLKKPLLLQQFLERSRVQARP